MLSNLSHATTETAILTQALPREKVLLQTMHTPHSSTWLTVTPTPHLSMSAAAYRMALRYKTGHQIYSMACPCNKCTTANAMSDVFGDHDAVCPGGGRLVRRHNRVRDVIHDAAARALLAPREEAANTIHTGERPADVLIPHWIGPKAMCIDVSIVSPHGRSALGRTTTTAAEQAKKLKVSKYRAWCEMLFTPFILETTGGWGAQTKHIITRLARETADITRQDIPSAIRDFRDRISFIAQQSMAEGFLLRNESDTGSM